MYSNINGSQLLEKFREYHIKAEDSEIFSFISELIGRELTFESDPSQIEISRSELLLNLHAYNIGAEELNEHPIAKEIVRLTPMELKQMNEFVKRMRDLLDHARTSKVKVIIEGEQSYLQDGIDSLT